MAGDSRRDDCRKVSTFHNNLQSNEKSSSTEYSVDLLETIFAFIDEDCDGLLSLNEMRTFLQDKVGISISVEELQTLLSNSNNTSTDIIESSSSSSTSSLFMDFRQFESILAGEPYSPSSNLESKKTENAIGKNASNESSKPNNNNNDDDDVKDCFCVFDTDGDGFISARELQSCLARMGLRSKEGLGYEVEECEGMIAKIDLDGNGLVDLYEFKEMMSLFF